MAAATPIRISRKSQDKLIEYIQNAQYAYNISGDYRNVMRNIDLAYMREVDATKENVRAKAANAAGDTNKIQNLVIPIILPQVESATVYQSSVFLTGHPIFGATAAPELMDQAMAMEAVIEEEQVRGGWVAELMAMFRDGFKYNVGACEVTWTREVSAAIETDLAFSAQEGRPKEVIWEGNTLKRMDMYNTFRDPRVETTEVHSKGEYVGYCKPYTRTALKGLLNSLPDKMVENQAAAFNSSYQGSTVATNSGGWGSLAYYVPQLRPDTTTPNGATDWISWFGGLTSNAKKDTNYSDLYLLTTIYCRIIPADFEINVPAARTPQLWKFLVVNNSILVYAERQTNAHNNLPIVFIQPQFDGLGSQTKSLAENVAPIQELTTSLMNGAIAARRRAVGDRCLYDPSRISESVINSANPSAKMPVRPTAFGKPLSESVYAFPFRDDQSGTILQEVSQFSSYANVISGSNPVRQGQFVKGNKTRTEFADVMANANGRDQMTSLLLESQFFTPVKNIIKYNILQYQAGTTIYSQQQGRPVTIDPVALRTAQVAFKISDGLTPADKLLNSDAFQVAMQVIGSSPQIGQAYNIAPLFSYIMKTQGAELKAFEKSPPQIAYEQAVQSWQQVVLEGMKQGAEPDKLPPQPVPAQFNYDPNAGGPSADGVTQAPAQQAAQAQSPQGAPVGTE